MRLARAAYDQFQANSKARGASSYISFDDLSVEEKLDWGLIANRVVETFGKELYAKAPPAPAVSDERSCPRLIKFEASPSAWGHE